jgi:hypothetical protein
MNDPEHARSQRARKAAALLVHASTRSDAAKALQNVPSDLLAVSVWVFLTAIPGVGNVKARRLCQAADVFPMLQLRDLTWSERLGLAAELLR